MENLITKFAAQKSGVDSTSVDKSGVLEKQDDNLETSVVAILNAVIGVLGLVCVVVMIYGGIQYMTSSGDTGKVKNAKNTILYGLIGLIICALAFAIVNFVIDKILGQSS